MLRKKSKQYATALYSVAKKHNIVNDVYESLKFLLSLYEEDLSFRLFFYSVKVLPDEKVTILSSILGDRVHRIVLEFLGLLAERKEHELFRASVSAFDLIYRREMNVVLVTAITAIPLEEIELREISKKLELLLEKHVEIKTQIDQQLIGGLKLRIGNTFLDGSIATQLEKMKQSLLELSTSGRELSR